jgi:hypothetical protein
VAAVDAGVVVILLVVGVVIAVVYSRGRRLLSFIAELVFDYLVSEMQIFHIQNPVVVLTIVLVSAHADLRLIPTDVRRGGIRPEGRACGIRRTRCGGAIARRGGAWGIRSARGAGGGSIRRTRCRT